MTKETVTHETNNVELEAVSRVAAAYLQNNQVTVDGIAGVVSAVRAALLNGSAATGAASAAVLSTEPAVDPAKSVERDSIVCLFDGKKFKTLRRHLMATYNMTPEQYRAHFGLPADYPMVAPAYAERRSDLARRHGLGRGNK